MSRHCPAIADLPDGSNPAKHSTWDKQKERDRDRLREFERNVRAAKRDSDPDAIGEAQAALRVHVAETGIIRRPYREQLPFADGGDANPRGRSVPTPPTRRRPGSLFVPDGLNVDPHEMATAQRLQQLGYNVRFRPLVHGDRIKNPDYYLDGILYEGKSPKGSGGSTISNQFAKGRKQAQRLVIDLQRCGLPDDVALQQIARRFHGQKRIREVIAFDHLGQVTFFRPTGNL